jgi:CysZ protein
MNPIGKFFLGIRHYLSGLKRLMIYPSLLLLAMVPILLSLAVVLFFAGGGAWLIGSWMSSSFSLPSESLIFMQALTFLIIVFIALWIYLPLTRIFLAPISEKISVKTFKIHGEMQPSDREVNFAHAIWEGVKLVALQIIVLGIVLLVSFIFPPLAPFLWIFITIIFVGMDFLDVPLSLRGLNVGEKLTFYWNNRALFLGFSFAGYLMLHIPLVQVLALPVGIIGGTMLVMRKISD